MLHMLQLLLYRKKINLGRKYAQALLIHMEVHAQKTTCAAEENDAYIDALTTLDIRDDADECIII
jgi:hypothetical protein